jgi:hypothetical protein
MRATAIACFYLLGFAANSFALEFVEGEIAVVSKNPAMSGDQVTFSAPVVPELVEYAWYFSDRFVFEDQSTNVFVNGNPIVRNITRVGGHFVIFEGIGDNGRVFRRDEFNIIISDPLTDSDGDGVSDALETELKTNPLDKSSTPVGARFPFAERSKLLIKGDENRIGKDQIGVEVIAQIKGELNGSTMVMDIGGVVKKFTLNQKNASARFYSGQGASSAEKIRIKKLGVIQDGAVEYQINVNLSRGNFAQTLFGGSLFTSNPYLTFSAIVNGQLLCATFPGVVVVQKERAFKASFFLSGFGGKFR